MDLSALVVTCVSDAHVAGPDHNWDLRLPDEPVVVSGDADRLHQVLANLLANARTHPAGNECHGHVVNRGIPVDQSEHNNAVGSHQGS